MLSVVVNSAEKSIELSLDSLTGQLGGSFTALFSTAYMLSLEWRLALPLLLYTLLLRLITRLAFQKQKKLGREAVAIEKESSSFLVDWLSNMMSVRLFDRGGFFASRLRQREKTLLRANMKRNLLSNFLSDGTWVFVKLSEFFLIYGLGAMLIYQGLTSAGVLIAFTFVLDVLMKGMDALAGAQSNRAQALAQIDSVKELLNASELEDEPEGALPGSPFAIRASGLCFCYGEKPVLQDVNFTILPGEKVLLRGPNGQGKSTLLKLLAGLYRPARGSISFGEQQTSALHLKSLSQAYSYIAQESSIFPDGAGENLALSREYDREQAERVFSQLGLRAVSENDPASFSQGERQRLNIGRALYRGSRPLILGDEIFANIDETNAGRILRLLEKEFAGCTVILVSHDPVDFPFDRVLTVENGSVFEEVCRQ